MDPRTIQELISVVGNTGMQPTAQFKNVSTVLTFSQQQHVAAETLLPAHSAPQCYAVWTLCSIFTFTFIFSFSTGAMKDLFVWLGSHTFRLLRINLQMPYSMNDNTDHSLQIFETFMTHPVEYFSIFQVTLYLCEFLSTCYKTKRCK